MKKAVIVGHSGQDGRCLWQYLEQKRYRLIGISSRETVGALSGDVAQVDITSPEQVDNLVRAFSPDEVYYLAAVHQSSSDELPDDGELFRASIRVNITSLVHFLEAVRKHNPETRIFYAASSH